MLHDLPPWHAVDQQSPCWFKAGVFEAMVHDLRGVLRLAHGRNAYPSVVGVVIVMPKRFVELIV
jgi:transposase